MTSPTNILIIQTSFIGDVILATALLESIHQESPEANLSILVRKGNESLFEHHPFIKQVIVWDKKQGKYSSLWKDIVVTRDAGKMLPGVDNRTAPIKKGDRIA